VLPSLYKMGSNRAQQKNGSGRKGAVSPALAIIRK